MHSSDILVLVCDECWVKRNGKRRKPYRVHNPEKGICADCGHETESGIYIALHPEIDAAE